MSKYIAFDINSNKTVACLGQKGTKDRYATFKNRYNFFPLTLMKTTGAYTEFNWYKPRIDTNPFTSPVRAAHQATEPPTSFSQRHP